MNLRHSYVTASAAAALLATSIFSVTSAAQNPAPAVADSSQATATADNLPAWAYPPAPAGRGGRGGRGPGAGGAATGGAATGSPNATVAGATGATAGGVPGATPGAAASNPGGTPAAAPGAGGGRGPGGGPADDGTVKHIPGSSVGYTSTQVRNMYDIPDWFPDAHPAMPDMVSHGDRERNAGGCGYCHLPNGYGRTENQTVAGLPAQYIIDQVADFKSGARKTSGSRIAPVNTMVREAQNATDDEVKIAASYFASIKPKPWIRVVETDTVPKTKVAASVYQLADGGGSEPIGERIIEMAEDQERFELRDASSGFVAYVPTGSIQKGKVLVTTGGGGKTLPCTVCHGADLKGLGNIPPIAGRSPSQLARQIIDIQNGNRNGTNAALMKPVVAKLTNDDIVNITAFLASLAP
jgi:cytochrome c553